LDRARAADAAVAADKEDRVEVWAEVEEQGKARVGLAFARSAEKRLPTGEEPRALSTPVRNAGPRWSAREIFLTEGKQNKRKERTCQVEIEQDRQVRVR
jgi:hypothetical protein